MATNNKNIDLNEVTDALSIISNYCISIRKKNCVDCPLSNIKNECLVYEYPYLWNVKQKTVVKLMQEGGD